ncbi:tyrosine-type recombinase/integrase [Candidatus Woesearchaeota archaeon]|nr:tyrosine-type recombinase/integrase [Candidatus Woesearchaeota archaeon]
MDILEAMKKEMFRRKLSPRTMGAYLFYVRKFLKFCKKEPKQFSKKDCREFLEQFMEKGISGSTLNVALNSLRFMMEEVLRKSMRLGIRYSKTPKSLATCLSKAEVLKLLSVIENPKHKLLVSLMYGAGLRVSEVVKLRPRDVELEQDIGWVRHGKGNKDRPFILPQCLKGQIAEIMREGNYLFPGAKHTHLSSRSVQEIVKRAARTARLEKDVHPHTLRHSFATHILEAGHDVTAVQALLGHNEARTTLGYLHMVKPKLISIKSPLDNAEQISQVQCVVPLPTGHPCA